MKLSGPFDVHKDGAKMIDIASGLREYLSELDRAEATGLNVTELRIKAQQHLATVQKIYNTYIAPALNQQ